MTIKNMLFVLLVVTSIVTTYGCKKFLEEKSVLNLTIPESLKDLQQVLDNPIMFKGLTMDNTATDEIYIEKDVWESLPELYSKGYVWDKALDNEEDWATMYQIVYYANTVLSNLEQLKIEGNAEAKAGIRGAALFFRANAFYQVAQIYAAQYDGSNASNLLGIPLRLDANFNISSKRSTLQETYDEIINGLKESVSLLPATSTKTRPNKASAYGLLARVYLQMGNYKDAIAASSEFLKITNKLLDYNTVSPNPQYPFLDFQTNVEIAFYAVSGTGLSGYEDLARIDSNLYVMYQDNDRRKSLFFLDNGDGTVSFRGKYTGGASLFTGIATDEIYLIKAESNARIGNLADALIDLNTLAAKRYDNTFIPFSISDQLELVDKILEERRKELLTRGVRWSDLKRLNKEPGRSITITRKLGDDTYVLPANDPRYVLLLPQRVINQTDLPQNPR